MKTYSAKKEEQRPRWYLIDANNAVVGRVAAKAAVILRGKNKPTFTPHVDTGDYVIVINAAKAVFTGKKETQKVYTSYSGYIGGHKAETVKARRMRRPELLIQNAVKGMIPHNRLGRAVLKKLRVYAGPEHPHAGQNPIAVTL
ncbi:MAG: 50S ribosomal protein L13 [Methylacidiphilales bacterium]|nr:50S ribosomal protein L13 [Candidatus Methylacidiphilales bacterium]MDW8349200.1 50S ribosomal protein L13 [Verrucomicrobiae bacterium]